MSCAAEARVGSCPRPDSDESETETDDGGQLAGSVHRQSFCKEFVLKVAATRAHTYTVRFLAPLRLTLDLFFESSPGDPEIQISH